MWIRCLASFHWDRFFFVWMGVLFSSLLFSSLHFTSLHFTLYLCTCPLFLSGLWSASKTIFRQFLSKLSFHFYSFRFFLDCFTYISLGASGDLEYFLITFITHHSFSGMREQLTRIQCTAARISMLRLLMQRPPTNCYAYTHRIPRTPANV